MAKEAMNGINTPNLQTTKTGWFEKHISGSFTQTFQLKESGPSFLDFFRNPTVKTSNTYEYYHVFGCFWMVLSRGRDQLLTLQGPTCHALDRALCAVAAWKDCLRDVSRLSRMRKPKLTGT